MSTPFIATENLGISLQKLREMVASSETFQREIPGGYGVALERVYLGRQQGTPTRPFAVIEHDRFGAGLIAGGDRNHLRLSGEITLHMERATDTSKDDHYTDAQDWFYGVLADVEGLAALDNTVGEFDESHLPVIQTNIDLLDENDIRDWATLGRFFLCRATISWGDG